MYMAVSRKPVVSRVSGKKIRRQVSDVSFLVRNFPQRASCHSSPNSKVLFLVRNFPRRASCHSSPNSKVPFSIRNFPRRASCHSSPNSKVQFLARDMDSRIGSVSVQYCNRFSRYRGKPITENNPVDLVHVLESIGSKGL